MDTMQSDSTQPNNTQFIELQCANIICDILKFWWSNEKPIKLYSALYIVIWLFTAIYTGINLIGNWYVFNINLLISLFALISALNVWYNCYTVISYYANIITIMESIATKNTFIICANSVCFCIACAVYFQILCKYEQSHEHIYSFINICANIIWHLILLLYVIVTKTYILVTYIKNYKTHGVFGPNEIAHEQSKNPMVIQMKHIADSFSLGTKNDKNTSNV